MKISSTNNSAFTVKRKASAMIALSSLSLLLLPTLTFSSVETACDNEFLCKFATLEWKDLDLESKYEYMEMGFHEKDWDTLENLRWYYISDWDDLSTKYQTNLEKLGWTKDKWDAKNTMVEGEDGYLINGHCKYDRPVVELRSWSRMTKEEQDIATELGFDEYTWHTKEFAMSAWQEEDGPNIKLDEIHKLRKPTIDIPYFKDGHYPKKEVLNIPDFDKLSWEALKATNEMVDVDDPQSMKKAYRGNDEFIDRISMPMSEFIDGIQNGKEYYIKYENEKQKVINDILGTHADKIIEKYLENTTSGEIARVGTSKYPNEKFTQYAQLYIGGKSTTTNMHLDIQTYNFLYVAKGRKRIRLLPNDQRYAKNFTWAFEADYSVWTGYDLLNEPLPADGIEIILGPGEGVAVPYLTWHAVENLEPSIAFGLIRDFPATESKKLFCNDEVFTEDGKIKDPNNHEEDHDHFDAEWWAYISQLEWSDIDEKSKQRLEQDGWTESTWHAEEEYDEEPEL